MTDILFTVKFNHRYRDYIFIGSEQDLKEKARPKGAPEIKTTTVLFLSETEKARGPRMDPAPWEQRGPAAMKIYTGMEPIESILKRNLIGIEQQMLKELEESPELIKRVRAGKLPVDKAYFILEDEKRRR